MKAAPHQHSPEEEEEVELDDRRSKVAEDLRSSGVAEGRGMEEEMVRAQKGFGLARRTSARAQLGEEVVDCDQWNPLGLVHELDSTLPRRLRERRGRSS